MREYVDQTWGWVEEAQAERFARGFESEKREIIELEGRP